uniref:Uncharacterized protein n=1 Tax=Strongyloides venezuelensis TaxID=75913 RepID=A0A0K0G5K5_STRVS
MESSRTRILEFWGQRSKEFGHKNEEYQKWKDADSLMFNFTIISLLIGQLKICNNEFAVMREIANLRKKNRMFLDRGSTKIE